MPTIKLKKASSFRDRALGLLDPANPRTLLFKTHFGIHTFFLKKPIDVLILDNNMRIIKMKKDLSPYRFYFYPPRYSTVIELPSGSIVKLNLSINDKIFIA